MSFYRINIKNSLDLSDKNIEKLHMDMRRLIITGSCKLWRASKLRRKKMANSELKSTRSSVSNSANSSSNTGIPPKKTKRRMKKQVRRTKGGLFMASAIIVAAIPAQGLQAAQQLKADTVADSRGSTNVNYVANDGSTNYETLSSAAYLTKPSTATEYKSYSVTPLSGGDYSYNWAFKFYETTGPFGTRAIINGYNNLYQTDNLILGNFLHNDFFTVTTTEYDAFYNDPTKGAKTHTIDYNDYENKKNGGSVPEIDWFIKYAPANYEIFKDLCEKYDSDYAEYQAYLVEKAAYDSEKTAHDAWDPTSGLPEPPLRREPDVVLPPTVPSAISFTPKDNFTNEEKYTYICSLMSDEGTLPGTGYTLVSVADYRNSTGGGTTEYIYLAKGGSPISPAKNDENGFLVTSDSTEVIGIAKDAFKGITNVKTISLPSEIKYIGDNAFAESFITGIDLPNVEEVGNAAFANCTQLATLTMDGTKKIGAYAFNNTGLTTVTMPYSMELIGYGAFAENNKLTNLECNNITNGCEVKPYAFYDDVALNSVNMKDAKINSLGEGAFSAVSTIKGGWTDVNLPDSITGEGSGILGDLLFAGRTNLNKVVFPTNYGTNSAVTVPSSMFRNCTNLSCVDFNAGPGSVVDGYVNFAAGAGSPPVFTYNDLFRDVLNPDFYVRGPEKNNSGVKAFPRQSTWQAFTSVSDYVPYVYVNASGVECYEVSDGTYLLQANENGELTSCELVNPSDTSPIDLVIPKTVGDYNVRSIANGCFDEAALRNRIRSITIDDDSLTGLDGHVFEDLPNLEVVYIGNSVASIGERAFASCPKLENVYFNTPSVGYSGFTIGNEAFKTGSSALTFHGDIVPGYEPFDFATGKDTGKIDDSGKRICYKSNSPSFLTCMYDNTTEEVVLLDYPKYNELDTRNADHNRAMEKYYYESTQASSSYNNDRDSFYAEWVSKIDSSGNISDADKNDLYENSQYFGPYLSDSAFVNYIETNYPYDSINHPENDIYYSGGSVKTALYPAKYFDKYPYSIIENYDDPRGSNDWNIPTDEERSWIQNCLNIVIPEGITSIDAYSFFESKDNLRNTSTYFGTGTEGNKSYQMSYGCKGTHDPQDSVEVVPGLFSGVYYDYYEPTASFPRDTEPYEQEIRGNDRIESISMSDVKKMPDYCFDSCEKLVSVILGDDLSEMGNAPFRGCDLMDNIVGNDYYAAENRIIYTVNPDGETYTIKECLPSRGTTGDTSVSSATDPKIAKVTAMEDGAFEQCDRIVRVDMSDSVGLKVVPKNAFNDCDMLQNVYLPDTVNRIEENAFANDTPITVQIPAKEVDIVTDAFDHSSQNTIRTYEDSAAWDFAKYYGLTAERISNLFTVSFVDFDGTIIEKHERVAENSSVDEPSPAPTRTGYTFDGWSDLGYKKVTKDVYTIAQYKPNSENRHKVTFYKMDGTTEWNVQYIDDGGAATAPLPPTEAGYTFKAWVPATFNSNVTKDMDIVATYEKGGSPAPTGSGSGGGSSASPTPTANNNNASVKTYTVSVSGGSGTGSYPAGATVAINAYDMGTGQVFDKWTTSTAGVAFANPNSTSTSFTMPAANVAITATFKAGNKGGGNNGGSGNNGGTNSSNSKNASNPSGTTIEVTKGGISNTNLAGASVNGSTDNFVVKVTDDATAAELALRALQNRYGDVSRFKYLPFDVSLYDSTGRTKIADTTGLSVNITLPLPDELAPYAGNNKVASVLGGQIEDLNARYTTVNGVPCINFTAPHLSPYMIYVDTANLTEATIDVTPKTGDPIHPKWFLSIGLACISLIFFFKRDKRVAVKSA